MGRVGVVERGGVGDSDWSRGCYCDMRYVLVKIKNYRTTKTCMFDSRSLCSVNTSTFSMRINESLL